MTGSPSISNLAASPSSVAAARQRPSDGLGADTWGALSIRPTSSRRRRVYIQLLLVVVLGAWINYAWPRVQQVPSAASMRLHDKLGYLIGRSSCPHILTPHGTVDQAIEQRSRACFPISSADARFRIEICPVVATCNSFSVIIQRTDSDECERLQQIEPPVSSPESKQWLRERKGPDSYFLRTNGAQRWVSELSVYEGECRSRFDVTLTNGGPVWLELFWLYTEYAFFNEKSKLWPENHFQSLLDAPLRLELCPDRCPMRFAPRLRDGEMGLGTESATARTNPTPLLPECSLDEKIDGIWLPRNPMDVVDPPVQVVPPRTGIQPLMGVYEHFVPSCRWAHHGKQFDFDHEACTSSSKQVLFAGDSHGRYVLHALKYRLDNHTDYYTGHTTDHGPFHYEYGQLRMDFWWNAQDEYRKFDTGKLGTYDSILYSYGAWELMAGTTVEEFARKLEDFLLMVQEAQSLHDPDHRRPRENVFLVPPPIPPRLTGLARERADQRTNHRFAAYRDAAVELLDRYDWRIVDQFAIAMPVVLEINAVDGGHLSPGAAHGYIIDEVIAKLGLCHA